MSSKFSIFQLSYLNYAKLLQKVKINKNFKEWTEKIAKIFKEWNKEIDQIFENKTKKISQNI